MQRPLQAISLLVLAACAHASPSMGVTSSSSTATIRTNHGPVVVSIEVADTPDARERGLMGRTSLPPGHGMAFLFPDEGDSVTARFWMRDTTVPLSIAFWGADGTILAIHDMDPCTAEPCPTYGSPAPYAGALEVNQGFFEEHGVRVGDRIELS